MPDENVVDCRSEEGITVGLIDALITIAHTVAKRKISTKAEIEALEDLQDDEGYRRPFRYGGH